MNTTMTKKIIWRLKEPPTSEALRNLVKDGIVTKEQAQEILFNYEESTGVPERTSDKQDVESLKAEIKFLRELVDKLSTNRASETIQIIEKYRDYWPVHPQWYKPYEIYCRDNVQYDTMDLSLKATNLASLN